jgi:ferredoxin
VPSDWKNKKKVTTSEMKISVEPHKCVASGMCVLVEDSVFDQDETTGTVRLQVETDPPEDVRENVREAARVCPALAISISEDARPA